MRNGRFQRADTWRTCTLRPSLVASRQLFVAWPARVDSEAESMERLARELRSVQTMFPWIRAVKFGSYNFATRAFGSRIDPEIRILAALGPCRLAIDVGGNWGQSIYALKRVVRPDMVISFEPNPELAQKLAKEFSCDPSIIVEPFALGSQPSQSDFFIPSYRGFVYDGLASLSYDKAAGWLNAKRVARFDARKLKIKEHQVPVRTLDSLNLSPDIIKIDVQGHELEVIRGAAQTLSRSRPAIVVESPSDELIGQLDEIGLKHFGLSGDKLEHGYRSNVNSVFLCPDKHGSLVN